MTIAFGRNQQLYSAFGLPQQHILIALIRTSTSNEYDSRFAEVRVLARICFASRPAISLLNALDMRRGGKSMTRILLCLSNLVVLGCFRFLIRDFVKADAELFVFQSGHASHKFEGNGFAARGTWGENLSPQQRHFVARAMLRMLDTINSAQW